MVEEMTSLFPEFKTNVETTIKFVRWTNGLRVNDDYIKYYKTSNYIHFDLYFSLFIYMTFAHILNHELSFGYGKIITVGVYFQC